MTASLNILAFDLDNTLLDPGSTLYAELHRTSLSDLTKDVPVATLLEEFERVRSCGDALERLGLANPIHDRSHPQSLAAFALTVSWTVFDNETTSRSPAMRKAFRLALDQLRILHDATREGAPKERLDREIHLRAVLLASNELRDFRNAALSLAQEPSVREQSRRYAAREAGQHHQDQLPLLRALTDRGATTVVVSYGRVDVQAGKLRRLELAEFFAGRLLVTEGASRIVGRDQLDRRIDEGLARCAFGAKPDDELLFLWRFRGVLDRWSRKTPEFYARCVHAVAENPDEGQRGLANLPSVSQNEWRDRDIRFVMVGDRHDTDIEPVLAGLGRDQCETIHLRAGKYADVAPANSADAITAHCTFTRWADVENYLLNDLDWIRVNPIRTPPPLLCPADFDDDLLHFGLRNPLSAVRAISEFVMHGRC